MRFDGGSVPVGDLVFSSKTKTVAELQDAALFKVRPLFATLPGVSAPPPFGSSQRTILVRLDPDKLRSYNMSPDEVVQALGTGNTVSPSGNVRIGELMPMVPVNSVVGDFKGLNDIPIRSKGTQTIFIRDVGSVEDGSAGSACANVPIRLNSPEAPSTIPTSSVAAHNDTVDKRLMSRSFAKKGSGAFASSNATRPSP
jgi:multidrug efflux pump subunit AcrB